jgi:hypothetical protein
MHVELTARHADAIGADLVAAATGASASELGAPERAMTDADPVAIVYRDGAPLAVIALQPDLDGLRTAAARAVRACRGGGTVAWALDESLAVPVGEQVRALSTPVLPRRWHGMSRSGGAIPRPRC